MAPAAEVPNPNVRFAVDAVANIKRDISKNLFGLENSLEELLIALMARGHVLLEDVPGVGKTALAKSFSTHLGLTFRRIQCTPDLLPSDIVGGLVFHPANAEFVLRKGPVFANILLVDEINRALPRTQSALLEAMGEGQVTIDGETHRPPWPFLVIATQNPVESQGVFPLPEAQLDRFLLKTTLGYPAKGTDSSLLKRHIEAFDAQSTDARDVSSSSEPELVSQYEGGHGSKLWSVLDLAIRSVRQTDDMYQYISDLVHATREHPDVRVGASPRAMILLTIAARAAAVIAGRDFVTPDDVQRVAPLVLFHRLVFHGHMAMNRPDRTMWISSLLRTVDVPMEYTEEIKR